MTKHQYQLRKHGTGQPCQDAAPKLTRSRDSRETCVFSSYLEPPGQPSSTSRWWDQRQPHLLHLNRLHYGISQQRTYASDKQEETKPLTCLYEVALPDPSPISHVFLPLCFQPACAQKFVAAHDNSCSNLKYFLFLKKNARKKRRVSFPPLVSSKILCSMTSCQACRALHVLLESTRRVVLNRSCFFLAVCQFWEILRFLCDAKPLHALLLSALLLLPSLLVLFLMSVPNRSLPNQILFCQKPRASLLRKPCGHTELALPSLSPSVRDN